MRLTSGFFISALIRRCFLEDATAVVLRRGAEEAGAIFVVVDRLDGTQDLYGPAPQTAIAADADDRRFEPLLARVTEAEVTRRLTRELRMDPDFWTVTIEDRQGRPFVTVV